MTETDEYENKCESAVKWLGKFDRVCNLYCSCGGKNPLCRDTKPYTLEQLSQKVMDEKGWDLNQYLTEFIEYIRGYAWYECADIGTDYKDEKDARLDFAMHIIHDKEWSPEKGAWI